MTRRPGFRGPRNVAVVVVTTALLLGAALSGATVGVADADTPSVSVTAETGGNTTEAASGETVTVTVGANASNVSAYQANLTFDPDVVQVVSVSGTDDFDDPVSNVDNETGWVAFNQYRSSNVDDPRLATVTVELVGGAGNETTLSFEESETKLSDDAAQERGLQQYDGLTVTVEPDPTESDGENDDDADDGSSGDDTDDDDGSSNDDGGDDTDGNDGSNNDDSDGDDGSSGDDSSNQNDNSQSDDDDDGGDDTDGDDGSNNDDGGDDGTGGGGSGGGSSGAEADDEEPEDPPRVTSHTASLTDDASVATTFDGNSPTIDRLEFLLESAASGEFVATEFERLPTDFADSRSDDGVLTIVEFTGPDGSEDASGEMTLTLNRSSNDTLETDVEDLQIERYDEETGRWEMLDAEIDGSNESTVTLTVDSSRLGWFVVSAGSSSGVDAASESTNGTNATSSASTEETNATSSGPMEETNTTADGAETGEGLETENATNAPSTEEPDSAQTETEAPGFGVTTVLAAGAMLYGYLRFGRRRS